MNTLSAENSLVLIIDIQERLVAALDKDVIVANAVKIASAAKALEIPVLLTEQYPKGLGHTVPQLQEVLPEGSDVVEKTYFNALLEDGMLDKIKSYGKLRTPQLRFTDDREIRRAFPQRSPVAHAVALCDRIYRPRREAHL